MGLLSDGPQRAQPTLTPHAMLVPWGLFAQQIGLVQRIQTVPIPQQTRDHAPQGKLLEFFAATLSVCTNLQDISRGPDPLDQDLGAAQTWGQERWADYSGDSRTLKACTPETVTPLAKAERWLQRSEQKVLGLQADLAVLEQHLAQFEEDNRSNRSPIRAIFRLDAGFGSGANVAVLIEMGYDVYTKADNNQVVRALRRRVSAASEWTTVGEDAAMVTWEGLTVANCPYPVGAEVPSPLRVLLRPLDVGLERFHVGAKEKHAVLVHYGRERAAQAPVRWFGFYNGRQSIEAGVKEGKSVLQMHHIRVRSAAGLAIQEPLTALAANFIRWAAEWFQQSNSTPAPLARAQASVKHSERIVANTSAWVIWQPQGCLLRFTDFSPFAGMELPVGNTVATQLPLPLFTNRAFGPT